MEGSNNKSGSISETLIILKNSINKGSTPDINNLEVGELALGLYSGEESIWVKNSDNEIINLRNPRHDLFWGNLLLEYDTLDEFNEDLSEGLIKNTCIVYIKDISGIWALGKFFISQNDFLDYAKCVPIDDISEILK